MTGTDTHDDHAVVIENVWKIFGSQAERALAAIRTRGIGKKEVHAQYNCVVGVADASLRVRNGEIFCIMGLSGSGKSTLVRHINRLLEPTAGRIIVQGADIMALGPEELRRYRNEHIAMVFQNFALLPHRSVFDNVAMPLEIRGINKNRRMEAAEKILAMVDLTGWGNKYAHQLSGGMQQRVGLARALAADPAILLMDEPFSALDPLIRRQLQDEFMQLASVMKKTTLFITHDLDEAVRIGDRIAIMRDGRMVQIGTAEEIVRHPADDYVADFVAGISRLRIVRARAIMQPIAEYRQAHGSVAENAPRFDGDANLSALITAAIKAESVILITDHSDRVVGVITRTDLLKTVIEGTETA